MPGILSRPGRWAQACFDSASPEYGCADVSQGDFSLEPWLIDGATMEFLGLYLELEPSGIIDEIDARPSGELYDENGNLLTTISYNSSLGYYVSDAAGPVYVYGLALAEIGGISVTLKNGDSCSVDWSQEYNVSNPSWALLASFEIVTISSSVSVDFAHFGTRGVVYYGDGDLEIFDAVGGDVSQTHIYASADTYQVRIYGDPTRQASFYVDMPFLSGGATGTIDLSDWARLNLWRIDNGLSGFVDSVLLPSTSLADGTGVSDFGKGSLAKAGVGLEYGLDGNTTSLDLSGYEGVLEYAKFNSLSQLSTLVLPSTSGGIRELAVINSKIGPIELDGLSWSPSSGEFINFTDNNWTTSEVNEQLVELDSVLSTYSGAGSPEIDMAGSNAAPDGSSGGNDGTSAKASLVSKGYAITTN